MAPTWIYLRIGDHWSVSSLKLAEDEATNQELGLLNNLSTTCSKSATCHFLVHLPLCFVHWRSETRFFFNFTANWCDSHWFPYSLFMLCWLTGWCTLVWPNTEFAALALTFSRDGSVGRWPIVTNGHCSVHVKQRARCHEIFMWIWVKCGSLFEKNTLKAVQTTYLGVINVIRLGYCKL